MEPWLTVELAERMHDDITDYLKMLIAESEASPTGADLSLYVRLLDHHAGRADWIERATGIRPEPLPTNTDWQTEASF